MLHLAQNEADPPAFEGDDITVDDVLAGFPGFAAWYGPTDAVEAALVTPKGRVRFRAAGRAEQLLY